MPEPQLSVRSARARDLAHRLARRERTTVAEIVERALETWGEDIDIDALIQDHRGPPPGPDL